MILQCSLIEKTKQNEVQWMEDEAGKIKGGNKVQLFFFFLTGRAINHWSNLQDWKRLSIIQGPEVKTGWLSEVHIPRQCPVVSTMEDRSTATDQILQDVKTNYHNCTV